MELKKLGHLLEERAVRHDDNRREVQEELNEICYRMTEEADLLEDKIGSEVRSAYEQTEERILGLIEKLENQEEGTSIDPLLKKAQEELLDEERYYISKTGETNFVDKYKLVTLPTIGSKEEEKPDPDASDIVEFVISQLQELLNRLYESMTEIQCELEDLCNRRRNEAKELNDRINGELGPLFGREEKRIQKAVSMVSKNIDNTDTDELKEVRLKGGMALLGNQSYSLRKNPRGDGYCVVTSKRVSLESFHFGERSPQGFSAQFLDKRNVVVSFTFFSDEEIEFLKPLKLRYELVLWFREKTKSEGPAKIFKKEYVLGDTKPIIFSNIFTPKKSYCLRGKIACRDSSTQWSEEAEFTAPDFDQCGWKECPDGIDPSRGYCINEENPRIVTKNTYGNLSTIMGNMTLPSNRVTSWSIKILSSKYNNGDEIRVGVVPFSISQDTNYFNEAGWYFNCCNSFLIPAPTQKYSYWNAYWVKKKDGNCARNGDSVGVVMDTTKGELSFMLNGVNHGVAFKGIPLDKPLVPCVILRYENDSVELDTSEVKENVDSSIPIPSNIKAKSTTWDSITFTWDAVEDVSFYKVELDDKLYCHDGASNLFTQKGFFSESKHTFRIQAVRRDGVSRWSDAVKGRTQKKPFKECVWKECPDDVDRDRKYSVDEENPRIAKMINGYYGCTIIGNAPLPLNKVTTWSIKILESERNDGNGIYIGVAPSDINQNEGGNYNKCGWYFDCYGSKLCSGPPHSYEWKEYGPRKGKGKYVHTGDSVGVVIDTAKGELSFELDGENLGVAFEGIPLDKPLFPCVVLYYKGDSVELDTSEVEEVKGNAVDVNINCSIQAPSNLKIRSAAWDSITLTWDKAEGASSYKVEVNGNRTLYASPTNTFTAKDLTEETDYTFRVCSVKGKETSKFSAILEGRTKKASFANSAWKECPSGVDKKKKYSTSKKSPRVATKTGGDYGFCTIIGNTPLSLKKISSWSIRVLRSKKNNGNDIYVGVAPFAVDQDNGNNHYSCGWYYHCYNSTLVSGPPQNYKDKGYGLRRKDEEYVHAGDTVGVSMNTRKGDLSFVVDGVNLGVAYKDIPLDRPLVPCVILGNQDDSVELII